MKCNMTLMYPFEAKRNKASESCSLLFDDFVDVIISIFIYKATTYNDTMMMMMMMMMMIMMKKIMQQ